MSHLDTSAELFTLKSRLEASAEQLLIGWLGQPTRKAARAWRWGSRGNFSSDLELYRRYSFEADQGSRLGARVAG